MWGTNLSLLRELLVLSFFQIVGRHATGGAYDKIVSQAFLPAWMWFPSCLPNIQSRFASFYFPEEFVP